MDLKEVISLHSHIPKIRVWQHYRYASYAQTLEISYRHQIHITVMTGGATFKSIIIGNLFTRFKAVISKKIYQAVVFESPFCRRDQTNRTHTSL